MASSAPSGRTRSSWRGGRDRGSNSRARGTGRGNRGGQWPRGGGPHINDSDRGRDELAAQPMGHLLTAITAPDAESSASPSSNTPSIRDVQYVASYSWLNRKTPTILIPGAPPAWTPPNVVPKLQQDSGPYFRDPNAAQWPQFPTEPAIRAVFALRPELQTTQIDLVGCGNTLGNLLRVADKTERTFLFRIEVINKTVFLVRRGTSPKELIPDVWGYGHTFPEAYTTWDKGLKGSVSHQRIITYRFGDINCLLRFESDGYIKEKARSGTTSSSAVGLEESALPKGEDLSQIAESLFVSERTDTKGNRLVIERAGREISQAAIFDIKTRSARSEIKMEEIYPRIWLSQIPNFIVAYHTAGKFTTPEPRDVQKEIEEWENQNKALLHRYYALVRKLINIARQSTDQKLEVRRIGSGPLEIRELSERSWSALPPNLTARWAGKPYEESDEEESEEENDDYLNF